jgi:hypothetical protein
MAELGFSDILNVAQSGAIIATLALTFYFSKRQSESLTMDVETKVLNDLDEKVHRLVQTPTIEIPANVISTSVKAPISVSSSPELRIRVFSH